MRLLKVIWSDITSRSGWVSNADVTSLVNAVVETVGWEHPSSGEGVLVLVNGLVAPFNGTLEYRYTDVIRIPEGVICSVIPLAVLGGVDDQPALH